MSLQDFRGQGPPGDIGTFQSPCSVLIYQYSFSGVTYIAAARQGDRGWVLVAPPSTDAATVFQAAHDDLPAVGSFSIYVAQGLYLITKVVNVTKPVRYIGDGIDTILRLADGANCRIFSFTMPGAVFHTCGLERLRLDGNKGNQTAGDHLIYFQDVYDPIVWRCWIYSAFKNGVVFSNVEKPIVQQNWFETCTKTGQTGYALWFSGTTTWAYAHHNRFYSNYYDILVGNNVVRATIENNGFVNASVGNVDLCGQVISCQHNFFTNPLAVDNTWTCIKVYGSASTSASKIEICNNIGKAAAPYRPKRLVYIDNYSEDVIVAENILEDWGTIFIWIHASAVNIRIWNNIGYNPVGNVATPYSVGAGNLRDTAGAQAFPTSATNYTVVESPKLITIYGGTITSVSIGGVATGQAGAATFAAYRLEPGQILNVVWTVQPSSVVYAC